MAVAVRLHDHAMLDAEPLVQREQHFLGRVGRRVVAPVGEGKPRARPEHVHMRVGGARRQLEFRLGRRGDPIRRIGGRVGGMLGHRFPYFVFRGPKFQCPSLRHCRIWATVAATKQSVYINGASERRGRVHGGRCDRYPGAGRRRHRPGDHRGDAWPCCAQPTPNSALGFAFEARRSAGPRTRPAAPHSRMPSEHAPRPPMACCSAPSRTTTIRRAAQGGLNPSGELRKRLDLYANIRPARSREGFPPRCGKPVDLVIVRENTEGFYADRSMHVGPANSCRRPISRSPCARSRATARRASPRARSSWRCSGARRSPAVHKANVLRVSDGLYLECTRAVAAKYPQVAIRRAHHRRHGGAAGARRRPVRRHRHHQHVRRHSVRRGSRDRRQPGPGRLAQCRRRSRRGAGAARLGARHRRQEYRQSVLADRLGGDAAGLARRAARRQQAGASRGAGDRERARPRHRRSEGRTPDLGGKLGTDAFGARVAEAVAS